MTIPVGSLTAFMSVKGAAQARADILGVRQAMSEAGASASASAAGFDRAEAGIAATARASVGASSAANKLRASQLDQIAAVERYNKVLADENATVAQLAKAEALLIRANERVTASTPKLASTAGFGPMAREADAATGSVSKFGGAMSSTLGMAKSLGLMFGAFELVKKGIDITKEANAFRSSMVMVQTNADVSAREVTKASAALLAMAGPVAASPLELATAWYHAKSVGLDYAKSLDTTRIAAEGARVGHADLEQTMNALTSTVASGIPGVNNMSNAMGVLIATVGSGDMKLTDLNEALGSGILSKMKIYGLSLTDVGAALATFGDLNIRGALAATDLRMAVEAMAKPAKGGVTALAELGLSATKLRDDMKTGGLNSAVIDLQNHLHAAGKDGDNLGGTLLDIFGKKGAGGVALLLANFDRLESKFKILNSSGATFGEKWKATTETASFALASFGHTLEAAGIELTARLGPSIAAVTHLLIGGFKTALQAAETAARPFVAAFVALEPVLAGVGSALGAVGHFLAPLTPVLGGVAGATLAMWAAFKGYQIARAAVTAIVDVFGAMQAKAGAALASVSTALNGTGTSAWAASLQVQAAEAAKVAEVDALEAQMAAREAQTATAVSLAAEEISAANAAEASAAADSAASYAVSAQTKADASEAAALKISVSATAASDTVIAEGEAARVGWAGIAGPLAIAAIGVLAIATMFGKSSSASKEATDAAKAYTDVLNTTNGSRGSTFVEAVIKQLTDNKVPQAINALNAALGHTAISGASFLTAVEGNDSALKTMQDRLQGVIDKNTVMRATILENGKVLTVTQDAALAATGGGKAKLLASNIVPTEEMQKRSTLAKKLLTDLNTQYGALSKAAQSELTNTAAFAGAAGAIQKTTVATELGTKAAQQYATMAGLEVSKNGIVAQSQGVVDAAVQRVSDAYNTATTAGDEYLKALDAFSKSSGTAADRAAIIGATLKANAGDALAFGAAINGAATATSTLASNIESAAKTGKEGTGTLLASIVNLKTGTIDYGKTAAAPLISDLQSIQSAAITAATATYQHNRALEGGKKAADDAVTGYRGVEDSLVRQLTKLGMTKDEAQRLTDKYLGVPSKVKTLIEQEGADPVLSVLNQIGQQLSYLTHHAWTATVQAVTSGISSVQRQLQDAFGQPIYQNVVVNTITGTTHPGVQMKAGGGYITGPGTSTSDSIPARLSTGEFVVKASQAGPNLGLLHAINSGAQGFAAGGRVGGGVPTGGALAAVVSAIAAALKQVVPTSVPVLSAALGSTTGTAITDAGPYQKAAASVASLTARLASLKSADAGAAAAAKAHALALSNQAYEASRSAQAMATTNTAAKANARALANEAYAAHQAAANISSKNKGAKKAAEERARELSAEARAASQAASQSNASLAADKKAAEQYARNLADRARSASQHATAVTAANHLAETSLVGFLTKVKAVSAAAKSAYDTAISAAAESAKALVAQLQSDASAMASMVQGFMSTISASIKPDDSLATLWGNSTNAVATATTNLAAAQQTVTSANEALAASMAPVISAQDAQASALGKLTAAHAALVAAGGDPAAMAVAQRNQTIAASDLAQAQTALSSAQSSVGNTAGATAKDMQALTDAQKAYNDAVAGNSVSGLQSSLDGLLASTKSFADDLTSLAKAGGNQDLVTQVAGMGATAGDALAKQLLAAGPKAITSLQTSIAAIATVAGDGAAALASQFYGAGVSAMDSLIAGLSARFPALSAALAPIFAEISALVAVPASTVTKAVTKAGGKPPGFASGVTNFDGGLAYVHAGEMLVNFTRPGTDVIPANRVKSMGGGDSSAVVAELRALNARVDGLAQGIADATDERGANLYAMAGQASASAHRRAGRKGA